MKYLFCFRIYFNILHLLGEQRRRRRVDCVDVSSSDVDKTCATADDTRQDTTRSPRRTTALDTNTNITVTENWRI